MIITEGAKIFGTIVKIGFKEKFLQNVISPWKDQLEKFLLATEIQP